MGQNFPIYYCIYSTYILLMYLTITFILIYFVPFVP